MVDAPTPQASEPVKPTPPPQPISYAPQLPEQLRKQMAQADQIRADIATVNAPPEQPGPPAEPGAPPQPATPEGEPPAGAGGPEESWEQRARSTQGRLEQALRSNQALSERVAQLEKTVATHQVRGEPQPKDPPPPQPVRLVTDQERQDYGDEFLQVVGKRAKEEYAPEFEQLAARLRRLEGRVDGVGQVIEKTQTQDVYSVLASQVPNWQQVNRSAEFKQWVDQPDLYSGRKRVDLLKEAFTGHDAKRVVAFFKGFLTEAAGPPSNPQGQPPSAPPLPGNGQASGKPSLEDFAAPGGARSAPQNLPPDKPVYTSAWIAKFTQDKLRGVYRGREADAEAIERDIYAAQHEGRIQ